jgi:hypothetical protein
MLSLVYFNFGTAKILSQLKLKIDDNSVWKATLTTVPVLVIITPTPR